MIYESKNKYIKEIIKENKDFCALYDILLVEANKQYSSFNIIESFKFKANEVQKSRINKIDTEEKISTMNRFTVYEMFTKEISLFKRFKEGRDYTKELCDFRQVKKINESEVIQLKSPNKEEEDNNENKTKMLKVKKKESSDSVTQYYDNLYWDINSNNFKSQYS